MSRNMNKRLLVLSIVVGFGLMVATSTYAGQQVGGLAIDYSPSFKKDTATANSWLSKFPDNIRQMVVSMDIFVAEPILA